MATFETFQDFAIPMRLSNIKRKIKVKKKIN